MCLRGTFRKRSSYQRIFLVTGSTPDLTNLLSKMKNLRVEGKDVFTYYYSPDDRVHKHPFQVSLSITLLKYLRFYNNNSNNKDEGVRVRLDSNIVGRGSCKITTST